MSIDRAWAMAFAEQWIAAWNAHDIERVLSHYADDVEMKSPLIAERLKKSDGYLKGKGQIREYWRPGLDAVPPLRFELIDVLAGIDSITIYYRSVGRRAVAEVLQFNDDRKVIKGLVHWSTDPEKASNLDN